MWAHIFLFKAKENKGCYCKGIIINIFVLNTGLGIDWNLTESKSTTHSPFQRLRSPVTN